MISKWDKVICSKITLICFNVSYHRNNNNSFCWCFTAKDSSALNSLQTASSSALSFKVFFSSLRTSLISKRRWFDFVQSWLIIWAFYSIVRQSENKKGDFVSIYQRRHKPCVHYVFMTFELAHFLLLYINEDLLPIAKPCHSHT